MGAGMLIRANSHVFSIHMIEEYPHTCKLTYKGIDGVIDRLISETELYIILEVYEMKDDISEEILRIINDSVAPLETKEVFERIRAEMSEVSRSKLVYRLNLLRGDGEIQGKSVGSGKGVWIWWKADTHE